MASETDGVTPADRRGTIRAFLEGDHARLDGLLEAATGSGRSIDMRAFDSFREGLLRHIAIEEKVLFPLLGGRVAGRHRELIEKLHRDHAAIAALLVPPPTEERIEWLRGVLGQHNPLEEGEAGLYAISDRAAGDELGAIEARMREYPPVRTQRYQEGERVRARIEQLLAARAARVTDD